jgi:hypothetical protein
MGTMSKPRIVSQVGAWRLVRMTKNYFVVESLEEDSLGAEQWKHCYAFQHQTGAMTTQEIPAWLLIRFLERMSRKRRRRAHK